MRGRRPLRRLFIRSRRGRADHRRPRSSGRNKVSAAGAAAARVDAGVRSRRRRSPFFCARRFFAHGVLARTYRRRHTRAVPHKPDRDRNVRSRRALRVRVGSVPRQRRDGRPQRQQGRMRPAVPAELRTVRERTRRRRARISAVAARHVPCRTRARAARAGRLVAKDRGARQERVVCFRRRFDMAAPARRAPRRERRRA